MSRRTESTDFIARFLPGDESFGETRALRLVVLNVLLMAALNAAFGAAALAVGYGAIAAFLTGFTFCLFIALPLARAGLSVTAKLVFALGAPLGIFLLSCLLGLESGVHFVLVELLTVPFALFNNRERRAQNLAILVAAALLMARMTWPENPLVPQLVESRISAVLLWPVVAATLLDLVVRFKLFSHYNHEHEQALARSVEQWQALVDNAPDMIITLDPLGNILSSNCQDEPTLARGQQFLSWFPSSERERADDALAKVMEGRSGAEMDIKRIEGRDTRWYTVRLRLLDRQRTRLLAILTEITERKESEEELTRARDEAENSTRSKSEFLATMSHEIRTPMNGVIGMTDMLLETNLDTQQHEYAEIIRSSGRTLLHLINDILDFSKIEAGHMELECVDFDPGEVVEHTIALLGNRASERGVQLVCDIGPEVPRLVGGDPARLRQVLMNLTGNAIKFTHEGQVVVRLRLTERGWSGVTLYVEVEDSGIGISEEMQWHLFNAFTQADSSTTRRYGGTGLGLAICKRIVEQMEGAIGVRSTPGSGSTFWFMVQLEERDGAADTERDQLDELQGKRALMVHEDRPLGEFYRRTMAEWKIRTEEARDAEAAWVTLLDAAGSAWPYDLVVLDLTLLGEAGVSLARRLHEEPSLSELRVFVLAARGESVALEFGPRMVQLFKPTRRDDLTAALAGRARAPDGEVVELSPAASEPARYGRLLVAEDNLVNQKVITYMLKRMGWACDVVSNGQLALEGATAGEYDAVLMDCQMPVMDGFEASTAIREAEAASGAARIPIIALTANAMKGDRERCLEAGMDDYLTKPLDQSALQGLLERWVHSEAA